MTKIACLLLRIYVRRENTKTGIQLCFNLVFTTASQKSHLNRKIIFFRLFSIVWMSPNFSPNQTHLSPNFHASIMNGDCHPSYVKDIGGKTGGKVGGNVPSLSPACPQLVTRRRKGCKY